MTVASTSPINTQHPTQRRRHEIAQHTESLELAQQDSKVLKRRCRPQDEAGLGQPAGMGCIRPMSAFEEA